MKALPFPLQRRSRENGAKSRTGWPGRSDFFNYEEARTTGPALC
jgi:hypothetical protein